MRVLQINTSCNSGSHGRIAEDIGKVLKNDGNESIIAYGRSAVKSESATIKIGTRASILCHGFKSLILDRHGFGTKNATIDFVREVKRLDPDLIHLHNLHGYYLNVRILFDYIKCVNKPVVWTFHDCWPFTGHCSYFDKVGCKKWQSGCYICPNKFGYPKSVLLDNSKRNYRDKKATFTGVAQMLLISPSQWLANHLKNSFLNEYEIRVINNGVDLDRFKPIDPEETKRKYKIGGKYILGVANIWGDRKGFNDFTELRKLIDRSVDIVLVGLSAQQKKLLPDGMTGISRTENIDELAALYSGAEVFVNPTYVDNFPSVNLESLACGTPVITYYTGGSPEAIDQQTGFSVSKGDVNSLADLVKLKLVKGKDEYLLKCRERAERLFDKNNRYGDYLSLYKEMTSNN